MIVLKDIKEIQKIIIEWEDKLKDFYDVAEIALRSKESKEVIALLRNNHITNLNVIKDTRIEDYGKAEWVRSAPDNIDKDLIPIKTITRESTPKEIFNQILKYEEKLKEFYSSISEIIFSRNHKELFTNLSAFKVRQISEIKRFMKSYTPGH